MRFRVKGTYKKNGYDVIALFEAETEDEASKQADEKGISVESVETDAPRVAGAKTGPGMQAVSEPRPQPQPVEGHEEAGVAEEPAPSAGAAEEEVGALPTPQPQDEPAADKTAADEGVGESMEATEASDVDSQIIFEDDDEPNSDSVDVLADDLSASDGLVAALDGFGTDEDDAGESFEQPASTETPASVAAEPAAPAAGGAKEKKGGGKTMLLVIIAVVALVVLAGGAVGAYFMFFAGDGVPPVKRTSQPAGGAADDSGNQDPTANGAAGDGTGDETGGDAVNGDATDTGDEDGSPDGDGDPIGEPDFGE